jgi:exopolysaccharide biosynthesis polyprenyl glycosylphosphotransferase
MRRLRRFGYNWRTAVVIGEKASCEQFAKLLTKTYPMGYRVIRIPLRGDESKAAIELIGRQLPESEDAFVIAGVQGSDTFTLSLLKEGKCVHVVPELLDARLFRQALGDVAGVPIISLLNRKLSAIEATLKRSADLIVSSLVLVLISPLFAAVAVAIRLTSSGPVVFGQKRLGKNGKPFRVFKFRTMIQNAEQVLKDNPNLYARYLANNFKLPAEEDPRITPIGGFLRATSLDELPQLLNVIRGDMSLVGPRPVVPAEVENYGDYAPLFLSAKPGMTGHWQVSGRSEIEEYSKRVELDLEYIRDQSLGKDLEILLRTVPAVLLRKGAH